jgi:hypothetical protein
MSKGPTGQSYTEWDAESIFDRWHAAILRAIQIPPRFRVSNFIPYRDDSAFSPAEKMP